MNFISKKYGRCLGWAKIQKIFLNWLIENVPWRTNFIDFNFKLFSFVIISDDSTEREFNLKMFDPLFLSPQSIYSSRTVKIRSLSSQCHGGQTFRLLFVAKINENTTDSKYREVNNLPKISKLRILFYNWFHTDVKSCIKIKYFNC